MLTQMIHAIRDWRRVALSLTTMVMALFVQAAWGQTYTYRASRTGNRNWLTDTHWVGDIIPLATNNERAQIQNNCVMTLNGTAEPVISLRVDAGATMIFTNAVLQANQADEITGLQGLIYQYDSQVWIRRWNLYGGAYHLHGGTLTVSDQDPGSTSGVFLSVHSNNSEAPMVFNQYGGTLLLHGLLQVGTSDTYRFGEYNLYGGAITNHSDIRIGIGNNTDSIFNLRGGEIVFAHPTTSRNLQVGGGRSDKSNEKGTLRMGNAESTGSIVEMDGAAAGNLRVRADGATATGILRGWGEIRLTGELKSSGMVVADGWAGATQDRTLYLGDFTTVTRDTTLSVTSENGWFACNRGKLVLPDVTFDAGNMTRAWGDVVDVALDDLDMVNSLRVTLNALTEAGSLSIALLAADRADVTPPADTVLLGVWDIDVRDGLTFGTADVTIRYDDALADESDMADWQGKLRVFRDAGAGWTLITGETVDGDNHRIAVTGLPGFSRIAVGLYEPSAGTVLMVR